MSTFDILVEKQNAFIAILTGAKLADGTKYSIADAFRVSQGIIMKTDDEIIRELASIPIESTTTKTEKTWIGATIVKTVPDLAAAQKVRTALNKAAGEYIMARTKYNQTAAGGGRRSRKNRNRRATRRNNRRSNRVTRSRNNKKITAIQ